MLWLTEDGNDGPRAPGSFEIDAAILNRKFEELRKHTTLGKFRFGSSDYDRWAVVLRGPCHHLRECAKDGIR